MSELWDALLQLDRDLPIWSRCLATVGSAIGISQVPRLWRWLHNRQKPFRCGPFVWKRNEEGDVYAGLRAAKYDYPIWSTGEWVEDDTPAAKEQVKDKKDPGEDQPAGD